MPWIAQTSTVDSGAGGLSVNGGATYWFRPDADALGDFTAFTTPSGVQPVKAKPCWEKYEEMFLGVGGWNENMVITKDWGFWQQGIRAPTVVPDVVLSAGAGITASVICYLSYAEYLDGVLIERSALSVGSSTLVAANQKITWTTVPTSANPRVTHLELWRSIDGSLPRLVMVREVGVTQVIEAVALADIGEAFTETFDLFPRCKYSAVWHGMQVMAGDDQSPNTLYLSLIGLPERWSLLTLDTKTRQPIVGLKVVHDKLLVFCPQATEAVTGYTSEDLSIDIAQPQLGSIGHHTTVDIHGNLWVATHLGIYLTDGTGWFPMMKDVWPKWVAEYGARRAQYEKAWAYHDPVGQVYKLYVGAHTDCTTVHPGINGQDETFANLNTFWVGDYTTVLPQLGGEIGQPWWSYDTSYRTYASGSALSLPGGKRSDVYLGGCEGTVFRDNDTSEDLWDDAGDHTTFGKRLLLIHGAEFHGDVGGDLAHGKRWIEDDVFVESENNDWSWAVWTGGERIIPSPQVTGPRTGPQFQRATDASFLAPTAVLDTWEPLESHHFPLKFAVGRSRTTALLAYKANRVQYRGYQTAWMEGEAPRRQMTPGEEV